MLIIRLLAICGTVAWLSYGFGKSGEEIRAKRIIKRLEDEVSYYRATMPYVYPGKENGNDSNN